MQVILVAQREGLGKIGDAVKVKDGFARNYLLPKKIAVLATSGNLDRITKLKKEQAAVEKKRVEEAQAAVKRISDLIISVKVKVGEDDKLFGSVTTADIEEALRQQGVEIDKRKIILEEPIKRLGEYAVSVKLYPEVSASLKVQVLKE